MKLRYEEYAQAQHAIAELKASVLRLLLRQEGNGLRNVDIGKALGIYRGHEGHVGHIPRSLLAQLQEEGLVYQDKDKLWYVSTTFEASPDE